MEFLATQLRLLAEEVARPNTITVAAGRDLIGASPLLSAAFHDEPTVEALNMLGLDITSVGNHEFDEGATSCCACRTAGATRVDGCRRRDAFAGAKFQYLVGQRFVDRQRRSRCCRPTRSGRSAA